MNGPFRMEPANWLRGENSPMNNRRYVINFDDYFINDKKFLSVNWTFWGRSPQRQINHFILNPYFRILQSLD